MTTMTTATTPAEAREWIRGQDESAEIDSETLDDALLALGYDPAQLTGDDEDPIDRRWDVACSEI